MTLITSDTESLLSNTRAEYVAEYKRLVAAGAMTPKVAQDWQHFSRLPADPVFDKLRQLWTRQESLYAMTPRGKAERDATASDSTVAPAPNTAADEVDPFDDVLLARLPSMFGEHLAADLALTLGVDVPRLLSSFRRIRQRLENCTAFECRAGNGLGIEVVKSNV